MVAADDRAAGGRVFSAKALGTLVKTVRLLAELREQRPFFRHVGITERGEKQNHLSLSVAISQRLKGARYFGSSFSDFLERSVGRSSELVVCSI